MDEKRRQILTSISIAGAGVLLAACRPASNTTSATNDDGRSDGPAPGELAPVDVTPAEDLMREHGILRRALLVYRESAIRLRQDPVSVPAEALEKVATLFRVFGEEYHEKRLEEVFVFPALKRTPAIAGTYVDALLAQHARGREITGYLLEVTKADRIPSNQVERVAKAMDSFAWMYEHHAAFEDTVIFPAWKTAAGENAMDEMAAKFEEVEAQQFGSDGFESALKRIEEIEMSLGMGNLETFTAPPIAK